ncbi:hypothetical protein DYB37_011999 [Aphanomyces astaci]|uniref:Uncharacterized protein n=1 Tax=Aphanomyces astaci TaxID=112090 RepID=A0A3R6ZX64_APHAT|nr:hypothetical protein DYB35_012547 [Aphanomyces astaci]RHZ14635.1 hypothetical protein DYB37_011999 [Aphanomyces astaci]
MQQDGYPPDRHDILVKANKLARQFDPLQSLTNGCLFKDCGVPRSYLYADWIVRRQVIRVVILCTRKKTRVSSRKTVDVGGRLLTLALLHEMDATKKERPEAAQRKKALKAKRKNKRGGIVLSPLALKRASIAAKLGMAPLSNGMVMSSEATEVVV